MHDEEHRGEQQHGAQQPAGGDELLPRDEHGGTIDGKQKERVDKVPRKPHEEGGDGEPDVAEHIAPRDGDKEDDRAKKQQRHPHRLTREKRPLLFVFSLLSATDSVQNSLRSAPKARAAF